MLAGSAVAPTTDPKNFDQNKLNQLPRNLAVDQAKVA